MTSTKRKQSERDKDSDHSPDQTNDRETEQKSNEFNTAISVSARKRVKTTKEIKDILRMQDGNPIVQICCDYEIRPKMAKHIPGLSDFEIVLVCDDSSSMKTPVDSSGLTRWSELCLMVKIIITICTMYDPNGIDIHFLNRESKLNVTDPNVVDELLQVPPKGYTPLVPALRNIFESPLARQGSDKKLLVFVATDGEPTDKDGKSNVSELKGLMEKVRQSDTTHVSFIACTDDRAVVRYLSCWDKTMKHVDVTDDFRTERNKIRRCQKNKNYPFSFGDYVVKALVGSFVRKIDVLNEENCKT